MVGEEELLVERAVSSVLAGLTGAVPVTRIRAGDVTTSELAELLSPSLFAEDRVVIVEAAGDAGKEPVALIEEAAKDLPEGISMVVVHSGGGRAKAMVPTLTKLGAVVTECAKVTSPRDRSDFVRNEFRARNVRVTGEVVDILIDAISKDLRELAAAVSQLVADTGGRVDVTAVNRYYAGRAEVTGFEIADKAVAGDVPGALEALRWAQLSGVPQVLIADALADSVHSIARIRGLGRAPDQFRDAGELGMAPWKIKKVGAIARRWDSQSLAAAMVIVAAANGNVKGLAVDQDFAVETAVRAVAELAG